MLESYIVYCLVIFACANIVAMVGIICNDDKTLKYYIAVLSLMFPPYALYLLIGELIRVYRNK